MSRCAHCAPGSENSNCRRQSNVDFGRFSSGIIQGVTEFLPISSDGHLTLYQHLTGNSGEGALFFNLMLHLGTLLAVIIAYHKEIWELICAFFGMVGDLLHGRFTFKNAGREPADDLHVCRRLSYTYIYC